MNKRIAKYISLIGLCTSGLMMARELRTPLSLIREYWHYPLPRPKDDDQRWNVDIWGAGLYRSADNAFLDTQGTTTESLAGIFFGKETFLGIEAFVPGSFDPLNPLLSVLQISPRFDYQEKVAYFGFTVDRGVGCDQTWHIGVRANLPFRDIKVELDTNCGDLCLEENFENLCRTHREQVPDEDGNLQVVEDAFACRLDFLASLPLTVNAPQEKLVKFGDGGVTTNITIAQQDVTNAPPNPLNKNPIHLIREINGTVPPAPFCLVQTAVNPAQPHVIDPNGLPDVGPDGLAIGDGQRGRFINGTNYSPLGASVANQRQLWVVPTVATQGVPGSLGLVPNARTIQTAIQSIVRSINESAIEFFNANGITFNTQRTAGLGNLQVEFYANREWGCNLYSDFFVGARFPTDIRLKNPGLLLKQSTGNNKHYELYFGAMGGWEPVEWFRLKVDAWYNFVLARTEKVAAAFQGATVKNIGPTVDAKVSWQWLVADFDLTFVVPCCPCVGFNVGYQPYIKFKDHVKFNQTSAIDLFGVTQPLDATVLEQKTNVVAHKLGAEIFYQANCWQLFAGWTRVIAGKNVPQDTDWYIGFDIYF